MGIERIGTNVIKMTAKISKNINQTADKIVTASAQFPSTNKLVERFQSVRKCKIRQNIGKYLISSTEQNFASSKQIFINLLDGNYDKSFLARISKSHNTVHLDRIINSEIIRLEKDLLKIIQLSKNLNGNIITLDLEQECYKFLKTRENLILAREKAFYIKSTNLQVVEIENLLKDKYGVKFVSLKDNEQAAQLILKAFDVAKKNNKSIPENVFVSDFVTRQGEYLPNSKSVIYTSDKINEIVKDSSQKIAKLFTNEEINILKEIFTKKQQHFYSTNFPEHVYLHEILHAEHPQLLAYKFQKLPPDFIPIKRMLGEYSAKRKSHETFVELNTKRCLQGLNEKEEELYNYLNFYA